MKILIFAPYSLSTSHHEVALEYALKAKQQSWETHVVTCPGNFLTCDQNTQHKLLRCMECRSVSAHSWQLVGIPSSHQHQYELLDLPKASKIPTFSSLQELNHYQYGSVPVGRGVAASLVSGLTRDIAPDTRKHDAFIKKAALTYIGIYNYTKDICTKLKPDRVYLFHGRSNVYHATFSAVRDLGIFCEVGERENYQDYLLFPNTTSLDLEYSKESLKEYKEKMLRDPNGTQIAEEWFRECPKGKGNLHNHFTELQKAGELPEGFSKDFLNVCIFTSSEDEVVAEKQWQNPLFTTQPQAVHYLFEQTATKKNVRFYLRIHPNLKGLNSTQEKRYLELASYPSVTVIPPESKLSSYSLLQACDNVIAFGSTIGIESVYWGKPVILVGAAFYKSLGACYIPQSPQEFVQMASSKLEAKPKELALPYAYWWAKRNIPFEFISPQDPKRMNTPTYKGENIMKTSHLVYRLNQLRFYTKKISETLKAFPLLSKART